MSANLAFASLRTSLVLLFVGIFVTVAGSVVAFVTGDPAWRFLSAGGGLVQVTGWVLYSRARRGGAA
ncbi:hypothetical protein F0344_16890 [Streptomyces finlayi]|uniref:Uncharacterized protein n=1 Tax=Streptomyces finlayi TaxID=67296 RepID=A0A7G7BL56_9ACTN|nr:hypothetical protein [Streptomyces finlayi]QNE76071.1 hypothetical protein F0344_16890 [Streptomyces finlayi]